MNEDKASPDLRFIIRATLLGAGDGRSLQNVNTTELPDGCIASVNADNSLWRLVKTSSTATQNGVSLRAGSGPGTWFLQASNAGLIQGVQITANNFSAFAVDGNWQQTTDSNCALDGSSETWSLTQPGCILVYEGTGIRSFMAQLSVAARVGNVGAARDVFLGISYNDDLTGAPSPGTSGQIDATIDTATADFPITTVRKVTMSPGDSLRPKMAAAAGATSLSAVIRMIVWPST